MPAGDAIDEHCFAVLQSFYDGPEHSRNPLHVEPAGQLFTGKEVKPDTGGQRQQDMGGAVAARSLVPSAVDDQTDPQLVGETGTSRRLKAADIQLPPAGELLEKAPLTKVPQKHPKTRGHAQVGSVNFWEIAGGHERTVATTCRGTGPLADKLRTYVRVSQTLF